MFIIVLYMFQATSCSSSGDQIVLIQHLVWSLSLNGRPVHRTAIYKECVKFAIPRFILRCTVSKT